MTKAYLIAQYKYMFEYNRVGFGGRTEAFSLRLVVAYDTKTIGPYENVLLPPGEPLYCAIYTLEGEGILQLKDGHELRIAAGKLVFLEHERLHSLKSSSATWHFHCYWFAKSDISLPYGRVFSYSKEEAQSTSFVLNIIRLLNSRNKYSLLEANSLFSSAVFSLLATLSETDYALQIPEKFRNILSDINGLLHSHKTLEEIAKDHGYCEKQLRNLFKRYMGSTPKQYILLQKVEKACQMLVFSSSSIEEISMSLGFSSPYLFAHTFKRYKGVSPTAYRARSAEKEKAPSFKEDALKK